MGRSHKPLTQHRLARMLKPLGIAPGKIGPEDKRVNGYKLEWFKEAFARYLPPEGASQPDIRTECDEMGTNERFQSGQPESGCPVEKCEKPNTDGLLSTCPVAKGVTGKTTHVWTAKPRSDDLPYTGPVVPVPDLGPDPLDEHGAPRSVHPRPSKPGEPGLSYRTIRQVADEYQERAYANAQGNGGDTRTAELDDWLRQHLAEEGVFPEFVEVEFKRVMTEVFRV